MLQILRRTALATMLLASAAPALATPPDDSPSKSEQALAQDKGNGHENDGTRISAPEINAGMVPAAITLVAGGVLILSERRRRAATQ